MNTFQWGDRLPTVFASRVMLRPLEEGDVADVFSLFADADAMGQWHPMRTLADAEEFIANAHLGFEHRRLFRWGIAGREDNRVIGSCGLFFVDPVHRRGEVGFALIPSRWGHGLATEAVTALVAFAFQKVALHRIEAFTLPANGRAARLLERLGFQKEGCLRERYHVGGRAVDVVAYGLLRSEWNGSTS